VIHHDLPLIDLHRHLDGSVRLSTILELGKKYGLDLPADTLEGLRPHVQVTEPLEDIMVYFGKFRWLVEILVDVTACERVAYENVLDARAEGLDYIELRFSPVFMAKPHSLDPTAVVGAVVDGINRGREAVGDDVQVNLLGIISRTYGVEVGMQELEALLAHQDEITGLDLAGDEANFPASLFVPHFKMARDAGWGITVHAGESAGTESIWSAIRDLGAQRIGHALHVMKDQALVETMISQEIGIEANLTSNVHTNTVASYADHPLKSWLDAGLLATINTDDPGISPVTLADEFKIAALKAGLTPEDTRKAQENAFRVAFLSDDEKQVLLEKKRVEP
jgi:adenosine deaminase